MNLSDKLGRRLTVQDFIRSEKASAKGIDNRIAPEHEANVRYLIDNLYDPLCDHFNAGIYVSSGYRSLALNKVTKGASLTSQHAKGQAIDLDQDGQPGPSNVQIFHQIRTMIFDQLIWELGDDKSPAWVHASIKSTGKNRRQILRCILLKNGNTKYLPWSST